MVLWKTGIKFSSPIHPAGLYEKCDVAFLRVDYIEHREPEDRHVRDNDLPGPVHGIPRGKYEVGVFPAFHGFGGTMPGMPPLRFYPQALAALEDIVVTHVHVPVQTQESGNPPVSVCGMLPVGLFHRIENFPAAKGGGRRTATEPLVIPGTAHARHPAEKLDGILMRQAFHDFELLVLKRMYSFLPSLPVRTV
jgi:hypothetical protein